MTTALSEEQRAALSDWHSLPESKRAATVRVLKDVWHTFAGQETGIHADEYKDHGGMADAVRYLIALAQAFAPVTPELPEEPKP
jgi:hypothetical protein